MTRYKHLDLEEKVRSHRRDLWVFAGILAGLWITLEVHAGQIDRLQLRIGELAGSVRSMEQERAKAARGKHVSRGTSTEKVSIDGNES